MGSVFLGVDPAIDRQVALKLMRAGFDAGQLRERFAREAKAVGRLHHPNIVTIFEYGEHEGEPFIAMEYVEGQTLANLVGRTDVALPEILALMDGLCAGLHYAHRAGIIHRDIKPVNVMVDGEGIVKILDFGIARAAAMSLTQAGTQPGTILGTLNYMSPEQLSGKPVDQRTDIFAVGAVFYELLAGRQAFPGDLNSGILQLILMTGPTPLETIRPDLDPAVYAIVNRCLERDADRRYPDLGVMRQDLAALRHSESTPRSAGATVILAPGASPSSISPASLRTPGPDTRAAAENARAAQLDADVNDAREALAREEYTRASDVVSRVLNVSPTHAGALAIRSELDTVRQARAWLADGQAQFDRGSLTAASTLVDRALAARPAMPEGLKLRAAIEEARARGTQVSSSAATVLLTPPVAHPSNAETLIVTPQAPAAAAPPAVAPSVMAASAPAPAKSKSSALAIGGIAALVALGAGAYFVFGRSTPPPAATLDAVTSPAPSAPPPTTAQPESPAAATAAPAPAPTPAASADKSAAPPATNKGNASATSAAPVTPPPTPSAPPATTTVAPKPASTTTVPPPTAPPTVEPPGEPPPAAGAGTRGGTGRGLRGGRTDNNGAPAGPPNGLERSCNAGNAHACTEAGLAYRNGRGVTRSDETSAPFFQKGCDGGDSFGCIDLGQLYVSGSGVAKDFNHAAALYQKGCEGTAPIGCLYLANMYENGRDLPRDNVKAANFYKRGCDGNNLVSCRNLGLLYQEGRGVPRNDQLALAAFQHACDGKFGAACTSIGQIFDQGRGVPKSPAQAQIFYSKGCDLGDENGCRLKGGGG
jgi:serine/threonine-protein kinase